MTRVLVTGAGGQLGKDLVSACEQQSIEVVGLDRAALDVTDATRVAEVLADVRPSLVVHAAAWTAVDACEADPARATAVNATGTANVATAARSVDAHLVYVSTDYVFDGTKDGAYVESDATSPQSVYGTTKLAGEAASGSDATIVRTSWVCGAGGPNMVRTILRLASAPGPLRFVDDQVGCPSFTADLAPRLLELGAARASGTWHLTNQGAVSWYEFARAVLEAAGEDPSRVEPISTAELDPPRPATRPANSVLENRALVRSGRPLLRRFEEPLRELVAQLAEGGPDGA